jgi:phage terminase small subunit
MEKVGISPFNPFAANSSPPRIVNAPVKRNPAIEIWTDATKNTIKVGSKNV